MEKILANGLIDFISKSPTQFHASNNIVNKLTENGFTELKENESWNLKQNGKYFITKNDSAVIAFKIGENIIKNGFKIISSHTDSPGFLIKPNSCINVSDNYIKLNIEPYGGAILSTWFDRPLSIAGKIVLKSKDVFKPKIRLFDAKKPILIIPNLAIHFNKDINNGYKYNAQKDMLPLFSIADNKTKGNDYIINIICENLEVKEKEILDFELYLYCCEKGCLLGYNDEFLSSSKLDDLMMVYTSLEAFCSSRNEKSTNILMCVDNEEVGSMTAQGARSNLLKSILERICLYEDDKEAYYKACSNSFMLSADLAHALHPNYIDKHDITNHPILGKGIVIKKSANQKYSTNSISESVFKQICIDYDIPFQNFVNRSDTSDGSTIGPMLSALLNIPVADIGAPILAMHSIRELCSVEDILYSYLSFKAFYDK